MKERPLTCPECGGAVVALQLRDPDTTQPFPWPRTSFGEWARCEQGHEWPVERGRERKEPPS